MCVPSDDGERTACADVIYCSSRNVLQARSSKSARRRWSGGSRLARSPIPNVRIVSGRVVRLPKPRTTSLTGQLFVPPIPSYCNINPHLASESATASASSQVKAASSSSRTTSRAPPPSARSCTLVGQQNTPCLGARCGCRLNRWQRRGTVVRSWTFCWR